MPCPKPPHPHCQVVTQAGLSGILHRGLLFAGTPVLSALVPLASAPACRLAGAHALENCPLSSTAFAVSGEGLLGYSATTVKVGPYPCPSVAVFNDTYLECHSMSGDGSGHVLSVTVGSTPATAVTATANQPFTVSFAANCSHKPGFWAGRACDSCAVSYYGGACDSQCPGSSAGPGGAPATVCSGHGACDAGVSGRGHCTCDADDASGHWAGHACGYCRAGFYGPQCRQRCPAADALGIGALETCGGHGTCDGGRGGSGNCSCTPDFAAPDCAAPCDACGPACPSGAGGICGGHGLCGAPGVCVCQASGYGHWAGPTCERCADGYAGHACDRPCPTAQGRVCGGHGVCTAAGTCDCDASDASGHWTGAACMQCRTGYVGARCATRCPGDPCRPCDGHGTCVAAGNGSSACRCDAGPRVGYWAGPDCGDCAAGYFSAGCRRQCAGGAARPCGGHGACDDGVRGAGTCTCAGHWAGPECGDCARGYFGDACARQCPGVGAVCSGHGRCRDGVGGDGACVCAAGYGGPACEAGCPLTAAGVCNGVGFCVEALGQCDCGVAPRGRWQGLACDRCLSGWTGAECDLQCPRGPGGRVCSGVGACAAANGVALCDCPGGFFGLACEGVCPGGALLPCSGHGVCDPLSGDCACEQSEVRGYWAGVACAACEAGWSGPQCTLQCLAGGGGAACSGAGRCLNGFCSCDPGRCGALCAENRTDCSGDCLAGTPTGPGGAVCSGRGDCVATPLGAGACNCHEGYAGPACALECPGAAAGAACAGHGVCGLHDGACVCYPGFATADCSRECPMAQGRVCGGHGVCRWGAEADGACLCDDGYAGSACDRLCPGFDPGTPGPACSGHGVCVQSTAACQCTETDGVWGGAACAVCRNGWFGAQCTRKCRHGRTEGRVCVCDAGFAAADCGVACPGPAGDRCHGHGTCRDGHTGNGSCACDALYYAADCSVRCDPVQCFAEGPVLFPEPHAACNGITGQCECQRSALGQWDGMCVRRGRLRGREGALLHLRSPRRC